MLTHFFSPSHAHIHHTCQKTPRWESQYEVMECILNWLRWLQTETILSSTPSILLCLFLPLFLSLSLVDSPAEGVWSLIKGQSAAKMYALSPEWGRAMGEENRSIRNPPFVPLCFSQPHLFWKKKEEKKRGEVWLITPIPEWLPSLPTNNSLDQYESVTAT